ncbi:MAG: hypothetical protein EA398_11760 [Deltaproteobacteria bacterium]|nr:MAG: hypothetical protein EA398_11760 [Deltaproteobacteria bacterium]
MPSTPHHRPRHAPLAPLLLGLAIVLALSGCRRGDGPVEPTPPAPWDGDLGLLLDREPTLWVHYRPATLRADGLVDPLLDTLDPLAFDPDAPDLDEVFLAFSLLSPGTPTLVARGTFPRDRLLAMVRGRPGTGGWVHSTIGRSSLFTDPASGAAIATPARNLLVQGDPERVREVLTLLEDVRDGTRATPASWFTDDADLTVRLRLGETTRRAIARRLDQPGAELLLRSLDALTLRLRGGAGSDAAPDVHLEVTADSAAAARVMAARLGAAVETRDGPPWLGWIDSVERDGSTLRMDAEISRQELAAAAGMLAGIFDGEAEPSMRTAATMGESRQLPEGDDNAGVRGHGGEDREDGEAADGAATGHADGAESSPARGTATAPAEVMGDGGRGGADTAREEDGDDGAGHGGDDGAGHGGDGDAGHGAGGDSAGGGEGDGAGGGEDESGGGDGAGGGAGGGLDRDRDGG